MQPLRTALQALEVPNLSDSEISTPSVRTRQELIVLQQLPPTAALQKEADSFPVVDGVSVAPSGVLIRLERGQIRDAIQAGRPEGCWCLGLGGRDSVALGGDEKGWRSFCGCEDGIAEERAQERTVRALRADRADIWRMRIWTEAAVPTRYTRASYRGWLDVVRATKNERLWMQAKEIVHSLVGVGGSQSVWMSGPVGSGKTGLAIAAMLHLVRTDTVASPLFVTAPELMLRIQATYSRREGEPTTEDVIRSVRDSDLLVLDDLGQEQGTDWSRSMLWNIVNTRSANLLPTIFTSNMSPEQLAARAGEATASRILEDAVVINLQGFPDLRLQRGKR